MTEVVPGIHWLKLPITMAGSNLAHVNVYLVRGDDGYLLVDAGWNTPASFDILQKGLKEIGGDIREISRILVTHVHPDHYGMAGRVKELSGADFYLHEYEKRLIGPRYVTMDELLVQTEHWLGINGVPPEPTADLRDATKDLIKYIVPSYPDTTLRGGETITTGPFTFRVLWTPGHSQGHICLYEAAKKLLLSGDHVLPTITPNIGMHPQSIENPLGKYFDSLKAVKKLDVGLVLPGHEEPFHGLAPRIEEIRQHHEHRNREILKAVAAAPKTAYQVALDVTWGFRGGWRDLHNFHKRMAIFETLAHLELMVANRDVEKAARDGMIYYRQT
ncbi:MAG: hypothetical protein A2Z05_06965 [Chloroflexi bacterium RBG_16_60_22]|nr:MAG: hypothetical protein A2Z05_06965 [Chloroflexi bacterium RBG_16_60_22]